MKAYLKGELELTEKGFSAGQYNYEANKQQIERYGLRSNQGQIAADRIYKVLNKLNQEFINSGIENYLKATYSEEDLEDRINVKLDQQTNYNNEVDTILDQLNFKRF